MSETVDEKAQEDGLAPESVVAGIACDRLMSISCGENNSVCFLYDLTDITAPVFFKAIHLSPASENKNPGVAYAEGSLGDLDAETIQFLTPQQSPTGQAGILFGGAISGTLSFWEFECTTPIAPATVPYRTTDGAAPVVTSAPTAAPQIRTPTNPVSSSDDDGLSGGAIAGIIIGVLVGVLLLGFVVSRTMCGKDAE